MIMSTKVDSQSCIIKKCGANASSLVANTLNRVGLKSNDEVLLASCRFVDGGFLDAEDFEIMRGKSRREKVRK